MEKLNAARGYHSSCYLNACERDVSNLNRVLSCPSFKLDSETPEWFTKLLHGVSSVKGVRKMILKKIIYDTCN